MAMTDPCISVTTGTLSPDSRVNYAFGMVLGLDDFLQEQLYEQETHYRHRRLLHGYGTSYGLQVTVDRATEGTADFIFTVHPGSGVDQWGREFVIRDAQCVRAGTWLAAQERANPGIIQQHADGSGGVNVYVVASYATCLDDLVPLPGRPCSSGDQTAVASRIRDAWNLELRWAPPPMPRWDTDRRLALLLASVGVGELGNLPGEDELYQAVRDLVGRVSDGPSDVDFPGAAPKAFEVRPDAARRVFDQVYRIWVTEVRPQLEPDLVAPSAAWDPAILLGSALVQPDPPPYDADEIPVQFVYGVRDAGRPYVLHTGVSQLLASPGGTASEPIEAVTLVPSSAGGNRFAVDAWFHLGRPVTLTQPVVVTNEAGATMSFTVSAKDPGGAPTNFAHVWTLTAPNNAVFTNGQQLSASFDRDTVLVDGFSPLAEWADTTGVTIVNRTDTGGLLAYTTATVTAPRVSALTASKAEPAGRAVTEFVTITGTDGRRGFELWFHLRPPGVQEALTVQTPQVRAFDEETGEPVTLTDPQQDPRYGNVWSVTADAPDGDRPAPTYLRFVFPAEGFLLAGDSSGTTPLADWIDGNAVDVVGWDRGTASIEVFHRAEGTRDDAAPAPAPARASHPRRGHGRSTPTPAKAGPATKPAGDADDPERSETP